MNLIINKQETAELLIADCDVVLEEKASFLIKGCGKGSGEWTSCERWFN